MKKNILSISIVFFSFSIVIFLFSYYWYLTHLFSYINSLTSGSTSTVINDNSIIWYHLTSSILTAFGLILIIISLKKINKALMITSIVFFSIAIALSVMGLIQYIPFPSNYSVNSKLFILLDFASLILTIIGLILVIIYTSKLKELNKSKLVLSATM